MNTNHALMEKKIQLAKMLRSEVTGMIASPLEKNYRARVSMRFNSEGQPCYNQPGSHTLIPVRECTKADARINRALADFPNIPTNLKAVEFRSNRDQLQINLRSHKGKRPSNSQLKPLLAVADSVALDGQVVLGLPLLPLNVLGAEHRLHPQTFYQVNLEVNELLVHEVVSRVIDAEPKSVLDLYSGAGNFSIPLVQRGIKVTAIESNPHAIRDAHRTVKRLTDQNGSNIFFKKNADRFQAGDYFFDVAILDPPRRGAPGVVAELIITRPRHLIYVSCNPKTLGRDIGSALDAGYKVESLLGYDMFPLTEHIEALIHLRR